jgi:hypothetical protein
MTGTMLDMRSMNRFHLLAAALCVCAALGASCSTGSTDPAPIPTTTEVVASTATGAPAATAAPTAETLPLIDAVGLLEVAREQPRAGYDRDLFTHWSDIDGDECDTRCEVLTRDFDEAVADTGGWLSPYDGVAATSPDEVQIDHVVALAEAWDSGADRWDAARREAFANDMDEPRALVAASAASNQAKSDGDPRQWLPVPDDQCRYVDAWVAVKYRWGLSADAAEVDVLSDIALACGQHQWVVPQLAADAPAPSTTVATTAAGEPFPNCSAARAAGAAPVHVGDPGYGEHLDGDGDGVACE